MLVLGVSARRGGVQSVGQALEERGEHQTPGPAMEGAVVEAAAGEEGETIMGNLLIMTHNFKYCGDKELTLKIY